MVERRKRDAGARERVFSRRIARGGGTPALDHCRSRSAPACLSPNPGPRRSASSRERLLAVSAVRRDAAPARARRSALRVRPLPARRRPRRVEDVVQDTFLVALERLACFDGRSSLHTWLCGIAKNKIRTARRRARPVRSTRCCPRPIPRSTRSCRGRERAVARAGARAARDARARRRDLVVAAARVPARAARQVRRGPVGRRDRRAQRQGREGDRVAADALAHGLRARLRAAREAARGVA